MNCKPGDLAVIVFSRITNSIGKIVEVIRPYDGPDVFVDRGPAWVVNFRGELFHCPDSFMRPIRDPGDDATDETLTWLPVASRESETA